MGLRIIRIIQNGASPRLYDYELYELYEFPKSGHPLVFTTTNYTNYTNFQKVGIPRLYDYELYELPKRRMSLSTTNYTNYTNFPMLTQRVPIRIIRLIRSLR